MVHGELLGLVSTGRKFRIDRGRIGTIVLYLRQILRPPGGGTVNDHDVRQSDQEPPSGATQPDRARGGRCRVQGREVRPGGARDRPAAAADVVDGKGLIAFPGVVDAHMHIGIYRNLAEDAPTESKCAAMGGVTTSLTYFRTGQYYLNKGGPYLEFFKDMLRAGRRPLPRGLRLPPHAGGQRAHRRDARHLRQARCAHLQALHVLRRLRAARQVGQPGRVPHDRAETSATISPTSSSCCAAPRRSSTCTRRRAISSASASTARTPSS